MGSTEMMKYRADIDGLRALAVVPVVLYHIGVPGFAGGFVGVDIFFVISGYLICGMIDADLRNGTFSLGISTSAGSCASCRRCSSCFWARPSWPTVFFLPVELEDYSKSLASAIASVSNIYFAGTAGYFDAPAETKPLLHTWSLGVEEQFYLITPLSHAVAPGASLEGTPNSCLRSLPLLSLAAAFAVSHRNQTFVFYLTPFRAWELAFGALLSIGFIPAPERPRSGRTSVAHRVIASARRHSSSDRHRLHCW